MLAPMKLLGLSRYSFCHSGANLSSTSYLVRDVMTTEVVTIDSNALLLDAALILRSSSIRHLLVIEDNKLVGVLSDRDVQRCAPSRLIPITEEGYNAVFAETRVNRVMTREPETVSPTTPLVEALTLMQESRFGCLPVVEGDTIAGILTRGDLVEALQRILSEKPLSRVSEG
jgi:acetoin utilization protein AcuB